jgi:histidinol phosphatase-like PHP family hydrolase
MKTTYTTTARAVCPRNKDVEDVYECIIRAERLIECEDILFEIESRSEKQIFQEQLCEELATAFGCEVTLIGEHHHVKTEVTCGEV